MMHALRQFFAMLLLGVLSFTANALVLEQEPDSFNGVDGGDGYLSVGPADTQVAEDFQFANNVTLTTISWWGSYDSAPPSTESFTVRIFESTVESDGTKNPADDFLYETIFTGPRDGNENLVDLFGVAVFRYDAGVSWLLSGGVNYYLSVFNNDGSQSWYWLESSDDLTGSNTAWFRRTDDDSWVFDKPALNLSFRLTGNSVTNIPEPTTLFLVFMPLLWLARKAVGKLNISVGSFSTPGKLGILARF